MIATRTFMTSRGLRDRAARLREGMGRAKDRHRVQTGDTTIEPPIDCFGGVATPVGLECRRAELRSLQRDLI